MAKGIFSEQALRKMIRSYKEKLEIHKIPVQKMYLYGSYAKKNPHFESDIDLCVVSPEFTDRIEATMTLMKLRSDDELFLSPIAFSPEAFVDENPLAWEVKQTGIEIN